MSLRSRLAVALCSAAACTVMLSACGTKTAHTTSPEAASAMADLPQPVINNAKDYIAKLETLNTQLDGISGSNSALKALPSIAENVAPINKLADQLSALSPETKATLGAAFGEQFNSLNSDFAANANRLLSSTETATLLKSTFNNVRLLGETSGGRWNATTTAAIINSTDD